MSVFLDKPKAIRLINARHRTASKRDVATVSISSAHTLRVTILPALHKALGSPAKYKLGFDAYRKLVYLIPSSEGNAGFKAVKNEKSLRVVVAGSVKPYPEFKAERIDAADCQYKVVEYQGADVLAVHAPHAFVEEPVAVVSGDAG